MGMLKVNPTLDRAANINALNGVYASPATAPAVGVGSQVHTDRINALNRVYANPSTIPVIEGRSIPLSLKIPSESRVSDFTPSNVPEAKINARAAQLEQQVTRYGSSRGMAAGGGFAMGFQDQQARAEARQQAQAQARSEWLKTQDGQRYQKLTNDFVDTYGGPGGLTYDRYVAALRSQDPTTLQDFAKLQAQSAYNDKLQRAIDAYQAKPENRRDLYDREVAKGDIAAPSGYKSDALDRYRKLYGDEKSVGDVKPYPDLTPNYGDLKPDIVFHPDGTVTYEKPDPNSSNIPLVLAPGSQQPTAPNSGTQNSGSGGLTSLVFLDPRAGAGYADLVRSYSIGAPRYYDPVRQIQCQSVTYVTLAGQTVTAPFVPDSLRTIPYGSPSDNTPTRTPEPIPTKPDGSADLKPFNPTVPSPVNSPSPSRASDLLPMLSPKNAPLGNLGSPEQLGQPLLDRLGDPIPAGQPSPFPMNPPPMNGSQLAPRVPSTGIGENNPVKATSANLTGTPINNTETKPPMVSVPTTSNPTKIDKSTAAKAKDQLAAQPKTDPKAQPQKARQCEDPCMQGLHDKADENAKQVEIKVKVFKACKTNTTGSTESNTTGNTATDTSKVDFEEKPFKVPASESDAYKLLYARIFALESLQCDDTSAIATIPEWWALRRGSDIPQLAILYAEVKSTGKLGDSRWTLHLPHYDKPKGYKPSIPSYTKGNWSSVLKLNDGTRIVVNASTKTEAQRVTNKLKILVPVAQRTNKKGKAIKARIVENQETPFKEVKVIPVRADFYSKGQLSGKPDWTITLRKK